MLILSGAQFILVLAGNEISNAPHSGILGGGVSNTFTANFLHDLCFEVSCHTVQCGGGGCSRRRATLRFCKCLTPCTRNVMNLLCVHHDRDADRLTMASIDGDQFVLAGFRQRELVCWPVLGEQGQHRGKQHVPAHPADRPHLSWGARSARWVRRRAAFASTNLPCRVGLTSRSRLVRQIPAAAIYLDDQLSGQSVVNNTIIDSHTGLLLGGGRDNYVHGNVFKNLSSGLAMTFDNRGMNWQESSCAYNATYTGGWRPLVAAVAAQPPFCSSDAEHRVPCPLACAGLLVQQLYSVNYQQPPYSTAFPELPGLLQNHPCVPVNNTISSNQWCQCSQGFIDRTANVTESWFSTVVDNVQISC